MTGLTDWITQGVAVLLSAVIGALTTLWATRNKARVDEAAAHLNGVNAATKQLIDALFNQINTLTVDVKRLREDYESTREELQKARADLKVWEEKYKALQEEVELLRSAYGDRLN